MKIAIFSDTFVPQVNGVANVVYQSAKHLASLGHNVWIFTVCQKPQHQSFWAEEKITVLTLPSIPAGAYKGERFTLPVGLAFRRLKEFQPDVIHAHTPFGVGWEAIWVARKLKIPLVGTHHTFYDHYLKHIKADFKWVKNFSWRYTTLFYNFCDLVLSPSSSLAQTLTQKGLKRPVEVLQNSVETDFFVPAPDQKTKTDLKKEFGLKGRSLVYMGRVSYEKSIDQVLKAFARVWRQKPDLQLMIVGDGPEKANLQRLARRLGVSEKVIFTGLLLNSDLVRALQANDIFVTASKSETFALSLSEALACGLPAVAANAKAFPEIVKDGQNGYLTPPDNPAAMAEKILMLLSDPPLLEKLSQGARSSALAYSHHKVIGDLEKIYQRIIKSKQ